MRLFITGAAGYIGGMLVERFAQRDDVEEVMCLDKNPITQELKSFPKVLYIRANTADDTWQDIVRERKPDVVIHCAWQIREFYFRKKLQEKWNLGGSRNVFSFIFNTPGITQLVYPSSVAVYGAHPDNAVNRPFVESDPMREHEYRYGVEKKQSEEMLMNLHNTSSSQSSVTVLRICSVTGQRYRAAKRGFTLQNMLAFLPFIPVANPEWGRQFVREDELISIIDQLCHSGAGRNPDKESIREGCLILNIAPSPFIKAAEIVRMYGKKMLPVPKELMRLAFFILRHLSLGRLPTSRGGWRFYVYPLAVDGGAISRENGFEYNI